MFRTDYPTILNINFPPLSFPLTCSHLLKAVRNALLQSQLLGNALWSGFDLNFRFPVHNLPAISMSSQQTSSPSLGPSLLVITFSRLIFVEYLKKSFSRQNFWPRHVHKWLTLSAKFPVFTLRIVEEIALDVLVFNTPRSQLLPSRHRYLPKNATKST